MRVFRGRAATIAADRDVNHRLLSVAAGGECAVRVWIPHRQIAFGRRDTRLDGYRRAREAAREHGFPPVERDVGGRAVAYDGETTLAFARAEPTDDFRTGTADRYDRATVDIEEALRSVDLEPIRGEPDDSFCPGTHSLSVADETDGGRPRKLVGIAQRVQQDAALVAGIVLVADRERLTDVLEGVYRTLGISFDPASVGTVEDAGGQPGPATVRTALEDALIGDAQTTVTNVR
ncbi:lipoate--protein ligase family protein [Natrinema halophilum]|uniref:Lipoate--protein ligase family protein n=1 Tax=Natrinema halophilum TaxID=1699371 RepID=A0A7D5L3K7_9EURY|nr:lipoate--protein ligase family protein [Natrinema halophilum]QLG50585.1 lipoate--protein ligase family protein [Natrinema halophilum]